MSRFKVGDVVTCVEDHSNRLIVGKTYTVLDINPPWVSVLDECGDRSEFYRNRFRLKVDDKPDQVNQPAHYTSSGTIECIDYIESCLGPEQFKGWLRGNIIKYQHRYELKGKPVEDLKKIAFYLDRLTKLEQKTKDNG